MNEHVVNNANCSPRSEETPRLLGPRLLARLSWLQVAAVILLWAASSQRYLAICVGQLTILAFNGLLSVDIWASSAVNPYPRGVYCSQEALGLELAIQNTLDVGISVSKSLNQNSVTIPTLCMGAIGIVGVVLAKVWANRRLPQARCRRCSYDLRGNTSGICPECGTAIPTSRLWTKR